MLITHQIGKKPFQNRTTNEWKLVIWIQLYSHCQWFEWCVHDNNNNNNLNQHSIQKMIHWCSIIIIIIMFVVPCDSKSSNETMMMNHIQSVLFKQMIWHKIFRLIFFIYWTLKTGHSGIGPEFGIGPWLSFFRKSFTFCHLFPEQLSEPCGFLWIRIES